MDMDVEVWKVYIYLSDTYKQACVLWTLPAPLAEVHRRYNIQGERIRRNARRTGLRMGVLQD